MWGLLTHVLGVSYIVSNVYLFHGVVSAMKTVYVGLVLLLAATASAKPQLPSVSGIKVLSFRVSDPFFFKFYSL